MNNIKTMTIGILIFISVVTLPFYLLNKLYNSISVRGVDMENGVMSLTTFDFNNSIAQRGYNLECFPNELLSPKEIENRIGTIYKSSPNVPNLTSRIKVIVPEEREYMLFIISSDFCSKIFVNGNLLDEIGVVGDSPENTIPKTKFNYYSVYPMNGKIEIVEQSANYYHSSASGHYISIGLPETVKAHVMNLQFDSILRIVIFFTMFLIHFGYFIFYPKVFANLYFSLLTLVICIREGLVGIKIWSTLLPDISWFILFRAEYISIALICTFFMLFINAFFKGILYKKFMYLMSAFNILYIIIVLFSPPLVFTRLLGYYEIGLLVGIVFVMIRVIWTIRRYSVEHYIFLAGIIVFFYGTIEDALFYQSLVMHTLFSGKGASIGIMCCIFVQMLALFLRTQREIVDTRETSKHLEIQNSLLEKSNRMKTEFLGNISHELKTPLTVITNYTELARLHAEKSESKDSYIIRNMRLVSSETERISLMVSQLLDVARIEDADIKWNFSGSDVNGIIMKTINNYFPVLNKNHNKIETSIEDNLPLIYVDEERIIQVLVNLIVNALRFTKRGTITIGAELCNSKSDVNIYVKDTGVGMSEEQLVHLFERFYTSRSDDRRSPGTGLGLYICKSIVESHSGKVSVKSEKDKGTIVTCTLPINNEVN